MTATAGIDPIRDFRIGETRARVYETTGNDGFAFDIVSGQTKFGINFEDYKPCLQAAVDAVLTAEAPIGHLPLPQWSDTLKTLYVERDVALKAVDTIIDRLYEDVARSYSQGDPDYPEHPYICRKYLPLLGDSGARSVLQSEIDDALGSLACTLETRVLHQLPQQAQYFSLPESYHMRIVWMKQLKAHISVL